jgi:hypothetical protein
MPGNNPSPTATSPCQTLLFSPRTLIAEHKLPDSEVPSWKQSIRNCYDEGFWRVGDGTSAYPISATFAAYPDGQQSPNSAEAVSGW